MQRWSVITAILLVGGGLGGYLVAPMLHGQPTAQAPATVMPRELTSYRDIVKAVMPAVVSIETKSATRVKLPARQNPFDGFSEEQQPRSGFGSGFIVDPSGVIMTNNHVVDGAEQVTVTLADGRKFTSKDVKVDSKTDLAIVRIDAKGQKLPFLAFGDSDVMEIGDRVLAFGAPFGLTGSVTNGIVSAKGRSGLSMNMYEDFIQTDAAINPGNSGGPLVNLEGKVIAVNAAIKSRSGGFQGVGLAIASNLAKQVKEALVRDGTVQRGYLGVQIRELQPAVAQRLGLPEGTGVVVGQVFDGGPGAKGGLQAGDIITKLGGKAVRDGRSLQYLVAAQPLGQAVAVEIVRDNRTQTVNVTIEAQPTDFGSARAPVPSQGRPERPGVSVGKLGVDLADLTDDVAEELGYPRGTRGVVVTQIASDGLAGELGLRRGMLILKVDNQPVANAATAREALERGSLSKGVLLQVRSPQGGTAYLLLQTAG